MFNLPSGTIIKLLMDQQRCAETTNKENNIEAFLKAEIAKQS